MVKHGKVLVSHKYQHLGTDLLWSLVNNTKYYICKFLFAVSKMQILFLCMASCNILLPSPVHSPQTMKAWVVLLKFSAESMSI